MSDFDSESSAASSTAGDEGLEWEEEEDHHHQHDDNDAADTTTDDAAESRQQPKKGAIMPSRMADLLQALRPPTACRKKDQKRPAMMVVDVLVQRAPQGKHTEVLLIGRCEDGQSACIVCTSGWQPYLIVKAPHGWTDRRDVASALKERLHEKLLTYFEQKGGRGQPQRKKAPPPPAFIARLSTVAGKSIYGFSEQGPSSFLKLEMQSPYLVRALRDIFTGYWIDGEAQQQAKRRRVPGVSIQMHPFTMEPVLVQGATQTFHSNIDPVQQFMVDSGLVGCQWVRAPAGDGDEPTPEERRSRCVHEWHAELSRIEFLDVDVRPEVAPLRILSFDLEAAGRHGVFPQATDDPVIQIALHFQVLGLQVEEEKKNRKQMATPSPTDFFTLRSFAQEHGLLLQEEVALWRQPLLLAKVEPSLEAICREHQIELGPRIKEGEAEVNLYAAEAAPHAQRLLEAAAREEAALGRHLWPVLLSLRACDPIEGAHVLCFEDEGALLRAFRDLVVAFDADVFTGYNILNFDFPYLHDRAAALSGEKARPDPPPRYTRDELEETAFGGSHVRHFDNMTRVHGTALGLKETEYHSAQTGKRKRTKVTIAGRVCLDLLVAIQNSQHRLESYKLDTVAEYFLGDRKVDLPFTQITPMWLKGPAERRELGVYCLKDAQLPLDLNAKIDVLTQTIEMARSTGILFDAVLQRGVMVRNTSLLLRRALVRGLLFPNLDDLAVSSSSGNSKGAAVAAIGRKKRFMGATVLEPACGVHRYVGVLDFSAMYPSIIRAHNLCYSTIVLDRHHPLFIPGAAAETPYEDEARGLLRVCEHTFVSEAHFKGLIPEIVEHLQNCRNRAKKAYAQATDPMAKQVCKARELAFKIAGNGVYGALGSSLSLLPLLAIAESVTALGRRDILAVKRMAESMFPDGRVVYGDTDSVFVRLPLTEAEMVVTVDAVARASEMSVALAERVNTTLRAPKKIEFEKVFSTMLLLSKKRYAGLKYEAGFKFGAAAPPIDVKGLQSVRRDGSPLVRNLVRDVIRSILESGSETDAAALVRRRLLDIVDDKLPLEEYAVRKTLRKAMHDCCHPMHPSELRRIRAQAGLPPAADEHQPLSYAEQDQAILAKVPLPWRMRVRLPHVMLAWRMRLKDPGSAPVPGESITYVLTNNGGGKCFEKVETLETVRARHIPVDRAYYLKSLQVPVNNIFMPIFTQHLERHHGDPARAALMAQELLWDCIRGRRLEETPEKKRACIAASPLAMAFARQQRATHHP